jgi:hypothetical protein
MTEQNFKNHARIVPAFHFFVLGVFAVNLVWTAIRIVRTHFSVGSIIALLVAAALIVLAISARRFALTAQDRIIRLEEHLRFERLLPPDLKPRISEFSLEQLIGLRFAGDAELPDLARAVLDERLADRDAIKQRVKHWKADYLRV